MCQNTGERYPIIYCYSTFPQGQCCCNGKLYSLDVLFGIYDITFCLSACPFQLVFDMLVLQKHNAEMTVAAGEALYTLVCLHQVNIILLFNKELVKTLEPIC